jgi:hypothetical protein
MAYTIFLFAKYDNTILGEAEMKLGNLHKITQLLHPVLLTPDALKFHYTSLVLRIFKPQLPMKNLTKSFSNSLKKQVNIK